MVSNCMMMEDVIYGVMLNAKIDMEEKDPPVIALKNPIPDVLQIGKEIMQIAGINARYRKTTADSDDYKHHEGVKKSVADFFHLKCLL